MSMNDLRTALAEDDGSLPERWNPDDEPGTTLIGIYQRTETIFTSMGEAELAVIEDVDDGTVYGVLLGRSVLKKRFETLEPQPGDTIGLKYIGMVTPKGKDSRPYHNYVMKVMRGGAPVAAAEPRGGPADDDDDGTLPF